MKKALIHIGGHKTGSSAIQAFLTENHEKLLTKSIYYPLELLSDPKVMGLQAHHAVANAFKANGTVSELNSKVEVSVTESSARIEKQLNKYHESNLILSSENFIFMTEGEIEKFLNYLRNYEIQIILYVRRQDEALQALYQTSVYWGNIAQDFQSWQTSASVRNMFNYTHILSKWTSAGVNNITVKLYDNRTLIGASSVLDFLKTVQNAIGVKLEPSDFVINKGKINHGVPNFIVDLVRYYRSVPNGEVVINALRRFSSLIYYKQIGAYDIAPPSARKEILDYYFESNRELAKCYLSENEATILLGYKVENDDIEWKKLNAWNGSQLFRLIEDASSRIQELRDLGNSTPVTADTTLPCAKEDAE